MHMQPDRLYEVAGEASALLTAMSNRNRLMILCNLLSGEANVNDLMTKVGMNQSALSQQLARLRAANLVATRRDGQQIFYRLASTEVERVLAVLYDIYCAN